MTGRRTADPVTATATARERIPAAWRRATVATAGLWAVVVLVTVVAAGSVPPLGFTPDPAVPGFAGWPMPAQDGSGWPLLRDALVRFDALYYLGIAVDGYPPVPSGGGTPGAYAFLPLYPALVAGVATVLGGRVLLAATIVSTVATVVALAGIHRLAELLWAGLDDDRDRTAARAVTMTALFPTSFFLLAPYAESVHLAAVVWAVLWSVRGRPLRGGLLGAAAAASRPVGIALALPLLLVPDRTGTPPRWAHRLAAAAGPPLGLALVAVVGAVRGGDPLAAVAAQARWLRQWQSPVTSVRDAVVLALRDPGGPGGGYWLLDLVVAGVAVAAVAGLARWTWHRRADDLTRRLGSAVVVHGAVSIGGWLAQVFPDRPLMSVPRFALVVPAVLLGLTAATGRDGLGRAWIATSSVLLALHLLLFSRWYAVF